MRNYIRIACPNCETYLKCRVNARAQSAGWDGIALCPDCSFRSSVVVTYQVDAPGEQVQVKAEVPESGEAPAPQIVCPKCRTHGRVRSSARINSAIRWLRVYCLNERCKHRSNAYLVLVHQLSVIDGVLNVGVPYAPGLVQLAAQRIEESPEELIEI